MTPEQLDAIRARHDILASVPPRNIAEEMVLKDYDALLAEVDDLREKYQRMFDSNVALSKHQEALMAEVERLRKQGALKVCETCGYQYQADLSGCPMEVAQTAFALLDRSQAQLQTYQQVRVERDALRGSG